MIVWLWNGKVCYVINANNKIPSAFLWLMLEKSIKIFSLVFVNIIFAREYGPEQFGLFNYVLSIVMVFSIFSSLGMENVLVRDLVKFKDKQGLLLGTAMVMRLSSIVAVIPFLCVLGFAMGLGRAELILFFIVYSVLIVSSLNVAEFYFKSISDGKFFSLSSIISQVISAVIKLMAILNGWGIEIIAGAMLFEMIVLVLLMHLFYLKSSKGFTLDFSFDVAKGLIKEIWPLMISSVVVSLYMRLDQLMIGYLLGAVDVGYYSAVTRLNEAVYFFPIILVTILYPSLIKLMSSDEVKFQKVMQNIYSMMFLLAISFSLMISVFSEGILDVLYGGEYARANVVFIVHAWCSIFVFMGIVSSKYLVLNGWGRKLLFKSLLGLMLNVILNWVLIPMYGILGAAISTLVGQFAANYLYDYFDSDLKGLIYYKNRSLCFKFYRL